MANLVGKNILIVDEVDDTRTTLEYAVRELQKDVEAARRKLGRDKEGEGGETRFSIFVLHVSWIFPIFSVLVNERGETMIWRLSRKNFFPVSRSVECRANIPVYTEGYFTLYPPKRILNRYPLTNKKSEQRQTQKRPPPAIHDRQQPIPSSKDSLGRLDLLSVGSYVLPPIRSQTPLYNFVSYYFDKKNQFFEKLCTHAPKPAMTNKRGRCCCTGTSMNMTDWQLRKTSIKVGSSRTTEQKRAFFFKGGRLSKECLCVV